MLYKKLGIETVQDLLYHFPRSYIDLTNPFHIMEAPLDEPVAVKAVLLEKSREMRIRSGLSIFKMIAADDSGEFAVTIFNSRYTADKLVTGREYIFYGRVKGNFLKREMNSPEVYSSENAGILAVYPQTAGINSLLIRKNISQALESLSGDLNIIPPEILEKYGLIDTKTALTAIHNPAKNSDITPAFKRFVFEELLTLSCALSLIATENRKAKAVKMQSFDMAEFFSSLPFKPTCAQERCIAEAMADMTSHAPMNRLLQGDVGSGKTLVGAALIYFAFLNGCQSVMMAPTEILAEQHYYTMQRFFKSFEINIALLTGSTKASEKNLIYAGIKSGEIDLCVGTHAVISDKVEFKKLGLIITDEQHRFGVSQRTKLLEKSENSHVLLMSATPIPRTLSLIIYGELKLSVIDEMPAGRIPVDTFVIDSKKRMRALGFIKKAADNGEQSFIICPLIERGENGEDLKPAVDYADFLTAKLPGYRIELLHGKMKAREKEEIMHRFSQGETDILVSTTVVEVGVDVPGATIIMIENAERFGLSQLHQLRGRVGRGSKKSYCILVSDFKGETSRERLSMMKSTTDGFKLAEFDLKSRGPGDFLGLRQHGLPQFKIADLSDDLDTMQKAKEASEILLMADPMLKNKYPALYKNVRKLIARVGPRPN